MRHSTDILVVGFIILTCALGQTAQGAAATAESDATAASAAESPQRILQLDADHGLVTGGSLYIEAGPQYHSGRAQERPEEYELAAWVAWHEAGGAADAKLAFVCVSRTAATTGLSVNGGGVEAATAGKPQAAIEAAEALLGMRREGDKSGQPFVGRMGSVAVFSPVLTPNERAFLYNEGRGLAYGELPRRLKAKCRRWHTWGGPRDYVHVDLVSGERVALPGKPEPPAPGAPLTDDGQEAVHEGSVTRWVDRQQGRVFTWAPGLEPMKYIDGPVSVEPGDDGALVSQGDAVISGRSRFALYAKTEQLSTTDKPRAIWSEIAPDGSGVLWLVKPGGIQSLRYVGPGGKVQAEVDASDSIHGRRRIEASTVSVLAQLDSRITREPVTSLPKTRVQLDIGKGHRFTEMDRIRLVGAGAYYDPLEMTVTHSEPDEGYLHFILDDDKTPPIAPEATAVNTGFVEHARTSDDDKPPFIQNWKEPSCIAVVRDGDTVGFWSGRHSLGEARVANLPVGPAGPVTACVGKPPAADLAATNDPLYHIEIYDAPPTPRQRADVLGRLTVLVNRKVDYLRAPFFISYDHFAWIDRTAIAEYQIETVFVDAATGKALQGEIHPVTGQDFLRATGPVVGRMLGSMDLEAPQEIDVVATVLQKHHAADGRVLPGEVLFHGPVARIVRKPKDARWRTTHVSWETGDDAGDGTPQRPLKTINMALHRGPNAGPFHHIRLKGSERIPDSGGPAGLPNQIVFGCKADYTRQTSRYGPIYLDSYGPGRPIWTNDEGWFGIQPGCRRIRVSDIDWENAGTNRGRFGIDWRGRATDISFVDWDIRMPEGKASGFLSQATDVAVHFGLLDNCRLVTNPNLQGYYSIFLCSMSRFVVATRIDDENVIRSRSSHEWRSGRMHKVELSHWRKRDVPNDPDSWDHFTIRYNSDVANITDMIGQKRDWHFDVTEIKNFGPSRAVRMERTDGRDVMLSPGVGYAIVQTLSAGDEGFFTMVPPEETRQVAARMRAIGTKAVVDRWTGFQTIPRTGPLANAVSPTLDFGPPAAQPLDVAEVQPDGRVVLRAEGPPLGGQGFARGGFERRRAGQAEVTPLVGIGAYYGTDNPGLGQWEYRSIAVDEKGNRSEGPWRATPLRTTAVTPSGPGSGDAPAVPPSP